MKAWIINCWALAWRGGRCMRKFNKQFLFSVEHLCALENILFIRMSQNFRSLEGGMLNVMDILFSTNVLVRPEGYMM
jgi:hypothetical protein